MSDPACDLTIAWTFFTQEDREIFRAKLSLDDDTWIRGRAWALWKAIIIAAGLSKAKSLESKNCWLIINEIIKDYKEI